MSDTQQHLFIITQHGYGLGHLVRATALAEALVASGRYRVTLFSGGCQVENFEISEPIEFVQLPATRFSQLTKTSRITPQPVDANLEFESVEELRSQMLLEYFHRLRPAAIITEYYPLSPERYGRTLDALIEAVKDARFACRLVSSLRSVPVDITHAPATHVNVFLKQHFAHVLHHADAGLFPLCEMSDYVRSVLDGVPVTQTGFVCRELDVNIDGEKGSGLLFAVGGGRDGLGYLRSWIEAVKQLNEADFFPVTIICGPLMSQADISEVSRLLDDRFHLLVNPPDMLLLIYRATAVVSMCGYNTINEALRLNKPLLVFARDGYAEQEIHRSVYTQHQLVLSGSFDDDVEIIAQQMLRLKSFKPAYLPDFNGVDASIQVIDQLLDSRG